MHKNLDQAIQHFSVKERKGGSRSQSMFMGRECVGWLPGLEGEKWLVSVPVCIT